MGLIYDPYDPNELIMFASTHIKAIAFVIIATLLMFLFRKVIRSRAPLRRGIKYLIIGMLIIPEIALHTWYLYYDIWDLQSSLPLELCSISQILGVIMLLTRSRTLFHFMFFAGIIGAIQAIVTPNLGYTVPHFRFFHFYIAHLGIILAPLYMVWIKNTDQHGSRLALRWSC